MIIIFRTPALSASDKAWPYVVLCGLLCFGFTGYAFEANQHAAIHGSATQANTFSDNLGAEPEIPANPERPAKLQLPVVLHANEKLQPIPYQPMQQNSINMPRLRDWQQSNNRVKDLGGWMFYASEAAANDATKHKHQHDETVPVKDQP